MHRPDQTNNTAKQAHREVRCEAEARDPARDRGHEHQYRTARKTDMPVALPLQPQVQVEIAAQLHEPSDFLPISITTRPATASNDQLTTLGQSSAVMIASGLSNVTANSSSTAANSSRTTAETGSV